jgi:hypothetical protein
MQSGATHVEIKVLHRHGWSISRIARELGLSRTTVRRELASEEPRQYTQRATPTALGEAQRAHVERRLAMCSSLRGPSCTTNSAGTTGIPAATRHLFGISDRCVRHQWPTH